MQRQEERALQEPVEDPNTTEAGGIMGGGRGRGRGGGGGGGGGEGGGGGVDVTGSGRVPSTSTVTAAKTSMGGGRVPLNSSSTTTAAAAAKNGQPQALTEFALSSPEIEAEMSADQFAVLSDVVGSIFLAQLADLPPRPSTAAAALLAVEGRSLVEGEVWLGRYCSLRHMMPAILMPFTS